MADNERRVSLLRDHFDPVLEARWDRIYNDSKPSRGGEERQDQAPKRQLGGKALEASAQIIPVQEELF